MRTLESIRREDELYYKTPLSIGTFEPLIAPETFAVEGRNGGFILQWSPVNGAEAYQISIGSTQDLANPTRGIFTVQGGNSNRWHYLVPSATRYFAMAVIRGGIVGPYTSLVAATSNAGAFDDTPTTASTPNPATPTTGNEGTFEPGWWGYDPNYPVD